MAPIAPLKMLVAPAAKAIVRLSDSLIGYLTTARLLPSGFLSLALSQSAAFVPFPARWRKTFTPITAGNLY